MVQLKKERDRVQHQLSGLNAAQALDYNQCRQVSMNRWLKLVGVLLIAGIVVAVVSPEFDSPVTVASVSKATQRPHFVVAFAVIKAASKWVQHSTPSPVVVLFHRFGDYPADLIALHCTRLC